MLSPARQMPWLSSSALRCTDVLTRVRMLRAALLLAWPPGTRLMTAFEQDGGALRADVVNVVPPAPLPEPVAVDEVTLNDEDDGESIDADPSLDTRWPTPNALVEDVEASERLRVVDTRDLEADAAACGVLQGLPGRRSAPV